MERIIAHWTAGSHKISEIDREHYHVIFDGDGTPVRGDHEISDNVSAGDGDYAAHPQLRHRLDRGFAGLHGRGDQQPFKPGAYPMTRKQWGAMIEGIAQLCFYKIAVTRQTVLSHAEVQGALGIKQVRKWDFTTLAFDPSVVGAKACGDRMRSEVSAKLAKL